MKKFLKRRNLKRTNSLSFFLPIKKIRYLRKSVLYFVGRAPWRILSVQCHCVIVPSWLFCRPKTFPYGYFVGLKYFFVGISRLGFPDCNIISCQLLSDKNEKYINTSQTEYSIPNRFQQLSILFILVLHLLRGHSKSTFARNFQFLTTLPLCSFLFVLHVPPLNVRLLQ